MYISIYIYVYIKINVTTHEGIAEMKCDVEQTMNWNSCTKLALIARWTHGLIAQSVRASESNLVVVASNSTQANYQLSIDASVSFGVFSPYHAWKVSKYGVLSALYFPVFRLNTKICGVNLSIQTEY